MKKRRRRRRRRRRKRRHGTYPKRRKLAREKALTLRVVKDLVRPFVGLNHVIYCDNFYSSGPLVDLLAKDSIFLVGTIKKCARGFPVSLKGVKPPKGSYVPDRVDDKRYFVFQDRRAKYHSLVESVRWNEEIQANFRESIEESSLVPRPSPLGEGLVRNIT